MTTATPHPVSAAVSDLMPAVNIVGTASTDTLAQCLEATERCVQDHALSEADAYAVRLAVDEACMNLVEHAYEGQAPGYMALVIALRWNAETQPPTPIEIHIRLRDRAPPFDPTTVAEPDVDAALEERRIGGLGWFFIHEMMQTVSYQTLPNGENELTMVRVCTPDEPEQQLHPTYPSI